jgi:hypothetical protein
MFTLCEQERKRKQSSVYPFPYLHTDLVLSAFPLPGKQGTSKVKDHLGLHLGRSGYTLGPQILVSPMRSLRSRALPGRQKLRVRSLRRNMEHMRRVWWTVCIFLWVKNKDSP